MVKNILLLSFVMGTTIVFSQEINEYGIPSSLIGLSVSSTGYSNYYNDEQHSTFTVDWKINEKNALLLRGYYDTNSMGDIFKTQLLFRKSISDRFYIFSGLEMNMERIVIDGANSTENFKAINGIGYKVQEDFLIELVNETIIGKQNLNNNYSKSLIRLGAKFKF
ncbi:hypothetical protein Celal_2863 [Cellulophaga algicola DSM 14237]|uniref:Outer membrane protein beta-barrel domain-containing protein n=1 Tax=Cellulophaga algicola (strain DSM 14237 / IC166 / ACAM 630) TaxID=688270 RepID=E6XDJ9_CELAD|nr:hypothetical protein [Cellulophaga algicola]ADV50141.1 hypothetical protein Celal_2863 [Cellulophaga algicola DSM 14237]